MVDDISVLPPAIEANRASLIRLARQYGSAYVYDLDAIRRNAERLHSTFGSTRFYYAVKANPLREIVVALADIAAGVEIASGGELAYVSELGVPPSRIIFAGPAKTADEVTSAIRVGVRALHIESATELGVALAAKARFGSTTLLTLRVHTSLPPDARADRRPESPSRFGFDEDMLPVMAREGTLRELRGIHVYAETQVLRPDHLARQFEHTIAVAERFQRLSGGRLEYLNLGGGFGVPTRAGESPLAIDRVAAGLRRLTIDSSLDRDVEIAIEPGRYLTAPYGVLVTTVRSVKISHGTRFILTDCGINGFLLPAITGQSHAIVHIAQPEVPQQDGGSPTVVGGPLCIPVDTFAQTTGWTAKEGQVVAILNAGAYGWSMSPQFFQGQPTIAEAVAEGHRLRVVRERVPANQYLHWGRVDKYLDDESE